MKRPLKRIILSILGILAIQVLAFALYFYIALSGNPIEKWREQRAVLNFYESRYDEDFKVIAADYDYKRNEFEFRLTPKNHSDLEFDSTLDETSRIDQYGAARSKAFLYDILSKAFGSDFDNLEFRVNVYESYDSQGIQETDLYSRLGQNEYVVDISWDAPELEPTKIDASFNEMVHRISDKLVTPVGSLKIRASVYNGKDFYHVDRVLR